MTRNQNRAKTRNGEGRIRVRNERLIIQAAIKVFARKGYDGARISEIAKLSGLPKPNVYYYFKTKEAIYRAIVRDLIESWDKALDELDESRNPAEAIAGYIRAKIDYSRRHMEESKIFANETVRGAKLLTAADIRHMREQTKQRDRVLQKWIDAGLIDPVDTRHLFILLWATTQFYADFDSLARMALDTKTLGAVQFEQAAATITQIVLKGCGIAMPLRKSAKNSVRGRIKARS